MRLVIAARKSDLARLQAYRVGDALREAHPGLEIEFHFRESLGDREQTNPLWKMPAKGVFTEDFVNGLETGEFDLVVHSWKDLPTEKREHTEVVATMKRADARDVLLVRKNVRGQNLAKWRVLSSSPRRVYFLQKAWKELSPNGSPELEFHSVRGNIPTRLTKLQQGEGECLLVAKAALDRLLTAPEAEFKSTQETLRRVLDDCDFMVIPLQVQPPAPAQGALAIEIRKDRLDLRARLEKIHCPQTFAAADWERAQLSKFGGGCHLKLGALQTEVRGQVVRYLAGSPPEGGAVDEIWIERKSPITRTPDSRRELVALRSEDLFVAEPVAASPAGEAGYISHIRAWPASTVKPRFVWTAGLKTWAKLAALGVWVNGSSESWGETRPEIDALAGRRLEWRKWSHADAPSRGELALEVTYNLVPRKDISSEIRVKLQSGTHFFWHSGLLFEEACRLEPSLRAKHHSAGLGHTQETLQKHLGTQAPEQIFLGEADWRVFYGA